MLIISLACKVKEIFERRLQGLDNMTPNEGSCNTLPEMHLPLL